MNDLVIFISDSDGYSKLYDALEWGARGDEENVDSDSDDEGEDSGWVDEDDHASDWNDEDDASDWDDDDDDDPCLTAEVKVRIRELHARARYQPC